MTNNDILRRLRYTLDLNDVQMTAVFRDGGQEAEVEEIVDWMRDDDDPGYDPMTDFALAVFLNGVIAHKRGAKEGAPPIPERELTNHDILRKLKIAFNFTTNDIQEVFNLTGKSLSAHEITAFFRRADQKQYRVLNDQYLRWFLKGLPLKLKKMKMQ